MKGIGMLTSYTLSGLEAVKACSAATSETPHPWYIVESYAGDTLR